MARIEAICVSERRGTQKRPVDKATFRAGHGIEGDAHAGDWHRQVSFLSFEKIEEFKREGAKVDEGSFGENVIASGVDFAALPVGTRMRSGNVLFEVTQIGKECHSHCAIYDAVGRCIMPTEGIFARVLQGGALHVGDSLEIVPGPYRAAVITLSDKGSRGERRDESGPALKERLEGAGYEVGDVVLMPDERETLAEKLRELCDGGGVDLVLTTGSTGFSPRDIAPEATLDVAERMAPGIAEAIRASSMRITSRAMLSRAVSVIRGSTLIINLPGSPKGAVESLDAVIDVLPHGLDVLRGKAGDCARR